MIATASTWMTALKGEESQRSYEMRFLWSTEGLVGRSTVASDHQRLRRGGVEAKIGIGRYVLFWTSRLPWG